MSRIGKTPITIPKGVKVEWRVPILKITGGKTVLIRKIHPAINLDVSGEAITVIPQDEKNSGSRALWGLSRTLVSNMVVGVSTGFSKVLEMTGVGWRAETDGKTLKLSLGFSHPVNISLPEGISAQVDSKTYKITLSGSDKESLGEAAAKIRALRKPEPYKGKGIRYEGERIIRKVGKAGGK
ncbi:MAG: 50S ribosomal protein L6 [Candidatus Adiutrix intracellularis]|jgi:large subunit ribosomal protein L6|nr:MAG: 50S ribosomal protein L6 [Candidatus Adiutrix intracellularis]MDR2826684.1 50S ribosomal protein L6 [Candidatus Adiutrix intracellularis]